MRKINRVACRSDFILRRWTAHNFRPALLLQIRLTSPPWGLGWRVRARRAFTVSELGGTSALELAVFLGEGRGSAAAATVASPVGS
jgi:hypothetical protein